MAVRATVPCGARAAEDERPVPCFWMPGSGPVAFSAIEERVIALATTDGLGSLEAPGPIERLLVYVFGLRTPRRTLADPRLESLRHAVVIARHRHHLPDTQAAELRQLGFSLVQIRMIEARAVAE